MSAVRTWRRRRFAAAVLASLTAVGLAGAVVGLGVVFATSIVIC